MLFACTLAAGCDDLRAFQTAPGDVFRGEVIGSDADPNVDSFIRKGFGSHTLLELTFDPSAADVALGSDASVSVQRMPVAGSIYTYQCPQGRAQCDASERTDGPFVNAPLIPIEALTHDPLSQYTFPGGGRLRNYIFGVHFVSESAESRTGRDAMLFISLMESGHVEVRAMAPGVLARDGEEERWPALFGVFSLSRVRR
jgi:hypothetical protein